MPKVSVRLNDIEARVIDQLRDAGLYGVDREEVILRILDDRMRQLVREGTAVTPPGLREG